MRDYVVSSLELHLFFSRIMKEHAFFLEIGFTKANPEYICDAKKFKEAFEELLCNVIELSQGIVGNEVLNSGEIITQYTFGSEEKTIQLTGAKLNQNITKLECELVGSCDNVYIDQCIAKKVNAINMRAIELLEGLIAFKKSILNQVLCCNMYTVNYPLLIEHIIREAELYLSYVQDLESGCGKEQENIQKVELFWNRIMMEHALFIRGLLDPKECELINTANNFAYEYQELINEALDMNEKTMHTVTENAVNETIKYRDFKAAGTKGINECAIRSLIVPLLADHVLREANHYLRLLGQVE